MKSLTRSLLVTVCLLSAAQCWAQAGLRVTLPSGAVLGDAPAGANSSLVLRFSDPTGSSATAAGPALATTQPLRLSGNSDDSSLSRSPTVWADWRPFDNGLRTSAGMMWRDTLSERTPTVDAMSAANFDVRDRVSTPFVGFGWVSTKSRTSRWSLSAEIGAYASGGGECRTAALSCAVSSGMGLKPGSGNDGIHWNPYLSFGASYSY
ncbi:hypothetical protein ACDA63_08630 [Uliginosibacterium sp. sgz301328]|uniref:hypothetical protein n=1 Tax=Uliginosibacterium sp. sgz301328 TaxID=3243764 RepID=UPI00359CCA89